MFEKAKLAKLLQEEVNELREKADELVTTTKELEALQEEVFLLRDPRLLTWRDDTWLEYPLEG